MWAAQPPTEGFYRRAALYQRNRQAAETLEWRLGRHTSSIPYVTPDTDHTRGDAGSAGRPWPVSVAVLSSPSSASAAPAHSKHHRRRRRMRDGDRSGCGDLRGPRLAAGDFRDEREEQGQAATPFWRDVRWSHLRRTPMEDAPHWVTRVKVPKVCPA